MAAPQTPLSVPPKTLYQAIISTDSSFVLNNIKDWAGNNLTSGSFGTQAFAAFISADRSMMELMEIDPSTIASASITILNRGLPFDGGQTPVTANKLSWPAGSTTVLLGTDTPQFMKAIYTYLESGTATFTNKRLTRRVVGTTSTATPAPNADTTDIYTLTALATNTVFVNPTGTPTNGQMLIIRIKSDGTIRTIGYGTAYENGGVTMPLATVANKILTIGFMYNTDNSLNKWMCIGSIQEA